MAKNSVLSLWALLTVTTVTQALPATVSQLAVHETAVIPAGWTHHSSAQGNEPVQLQIVIKHPHEDYLDISTAVSDPSSSRYGQYLDHVQLKSVLPDLSERTKAIMDWFHAESIEQYAVDDEWVTFYTTVDDARKLLNADFAYYTNNRDEPVVRTLSYSLPHYLTDIVDFIFPTVHFMGFGRAQSIESRLGKRLPPAIVNCTNSICPAQIKTLYNINYVPPISAPTIPSRIGVAGFLEQYIHAPDVAKFVEKYGFNTTKTPYTFSTSLLHDATNPANASSGAEAALDMEYVAALTNPLPVTYIATGGRPPTWSQPGNKSVGAKKSTNEPYLQLLNALLKDPSPPQVLSISYTDTEQTVPLAYANKVCNLFGRLAARGVSVIVASGDGGAAGTSGDVCTAPDGKTPRFLPTFPPSCPWVTSVGAVRDFSPPQPASYSSGGFSNYFGIPSWQADAIKGFQTKLGSENKAYYNASGRGIPDVTVVGDYFLTLTAGYTVQQRGTSASTPVFAAMIALLNDERLRAGKPVLGFLNPLLYSKNMTGAFTDVVDGDIGGCSFENGDYVAGWEAVEGWDAASGLGAPDFAQLRMLVV